MKRRTITFAVAAGLAGLWLLLYVFAGGIILHRALGHKGWPEMRSDDFRISPVMRLALHEPLMPVTPGQLRWRTVAPGYEVADLPVMMGTREVDRVYLNRIDPKLYVFSIHNQAQKRWTIKDWERQLPDAALIVNGAFFGPDRGPDTPFIIEGKAAGPMVYDAKAGAFVANADGASVIDLTGGQGWGTAFRGVDNAMVAYPLLIGEDGRPHVTRKSRWLANRSFVGEDHSGRIIVGSTKEAFFSLDREANFLLAAPLDLKTALNLDGGPVACQSVRAGTFHRLHIARWEAQVNGDRVNLLNQAVGMSDMPIVLVAMPRAVAR